MTKEDDAYSFLKRGRNMRQIVETIGDGRVTAMDIRVKTGLYLTHVCRDLKTLQKHDLVRCVNPKEVMGKLYVLTSLGKKLLTMLKK